MFKIVSKKFLNSNVVMMDILAPEVALKAEPGQFIILRADEDGERIPLTIAGYDREKGLIKIIFQVVGATTEKLKHKEASEYISDFVGPLGMPTDVNGLKNVIVIGGGVGCAIAHPVAKKMSDMGANVTSIIGFRSKDLIILQKEFERASREFYLTTDDGSAGEQGNVCVPLEKILSSRNVDKVFAIGPLVMMKFVAQVAKKYNTPCTVSMNPLMIDGTGMCGCCRVMLGGEMKFACVDGPDFDGAIVNFDEMMKRNKIYSEFERHKYEETCNLFKKEVK